MKKPLAAVLLALMMGATPSVAFDKADLGDFLAIGNCVGCDLTDADLTYADLDGADLTNANLTGAYFVGAVITMFFDTAILCNTTMPGGDVNNRDCLGSPAATPAAVGDHRSMLGERSVAFYSAACEVEYAHECVEVAVGCSDFDFEVTVLGFENSAIAQWIGGVPTPRAWIAIDGELYDLWPWDIPYGELYEWSIKAIPTSANSPSALWTALAGAQELVVDLGNRNIQVFLDDAMLADVAVTATNCRQQ